MTKSKAVRRALCLGVGAIGLAVPGLASAAISASITTPVANTAFEGVLRPVVRVTSDFTIASVIARVGTQSFPLSLVGANYQAQLRPAGLPNGPVTLEVTATDAFNATAVATVPLFHDVSPRLTINAPTSGTVARPNLHVDVSCTPLGLYPCTKISVYLAPDGADFSAGVPASAKLVTAANAATLVGDFPLTGTGGLACVVAETSIGLRDYACRSVFADTSPRLVPELVLAGPILDINTTRILYSVDRLCASLARDLCPEYRIRDRATGVETVLPTGEYSHLTSLGAVGNTEWRAGTVYPFVPAGKGMGKGNSIAWLSASGIHFRDVVTGAQGSYPPTPVSGTAITPQEVDVAENGDVVFGIRVFSAPIDWNLYRVRGGVPTRLPVTVGVRFYKPKTDGINVVTSTNNSSGYPSNLVMIDAANTEIVLARGNGTSSPFPTYALADGKVAFTRGMNLPGAEVWLRRPSGVIENLAPFASGTTEIEAMDSGERVMFIRGTARYETLPGMTSALVSYALGRAVSLGGVWYVVMGSTLFRIVDAPAPGGDGGAPLDAGADSASPSDGGGDRDAGSAGDAGAITDAGARAQDAGVRDSATPSESGGGGGSPLEPPPSASLPPGGGEPGEAESGSCSMHGAVPGSLVPAAFALGLAALVRRRRSRGGRPGRS